MEFNDLFENVRFPMPVEQYENTAKLFGGPEMFAIFLQMKIALAKEDKIAAAQMLPLIDDLEQKMQQAIRDSLAGIRSDFAKLLS